MKRYLLVEIDEHEVAYQLHCQNLTLGEVSTFCDFPAVEVKPKTHKAEVEVEGQLLIHFGKLVESSVIYGMQEELSESSNSAINYEWALDVSKPIMSMHYTRTATLTTLDIDPLVIFAKQRAVTSTEWFADNS